MRLQYIASEIVQGLRRNLTMTLALVVTIGIALSLFGTVLLMRSQVNALKGYWYNKIEVSIFLTQNVTDPQLATLRQELVTNPLVARVYFETSAQAYARFKQEYASTPDLVQNVSPNALPESFRVKLKNPKQYADLTSEFVGQPGILQIQDEHQILGPLFRILGGFEQAGLVIGLIGLLAAILLIANTVRVAVFSRRREIGIMRLVGASNSYIRLPFVLESAAAAVVGTALAFGGLFLFVHLFVDGQLRHYIRFVNFIGSSEVWAVLPLLLLLGIGMSAIASSLTLRRYLRV